MHNPHVTGKALTVCILVLESHLIGITCFQVTYLSIRNWQDSTDEKKERASFTKSAQDRCRLLLLHLCCVSLQHATDHHLQCIDSACTSCLQSNFTDGRNMSLIACSNAWRLHEQLACCYCRAMAEMSAKSSVRRQPKSKSGGKGFGS